MFLRQTISNQIYSYFLPKYSKFQLPSIFLLVGLKVTSKIIEITADRENSVAQPLFNSIPEMCQLHDQVGSI